MPTDLNVTANRFVFKLYALYLIVRRGRDRRQDYGYLLDGLLKVESILHSMFQEGPCVLELCIQIPKMARKTIEQSMMKLAMTITQIKHLHTENMTNYIIEEIHEIQGRTWLLSTKGFGADIAELYFSNNDTRPKKVNQQVKSTNLENDQ